MKSVTVRVPASTSNCGAGFDTLSLALSLYNTVTLSLEPGSEPRPARPSDARARDMVKETADAFCKAAGRAPAGFVYQIDGDVPTTRGLGSSVTVIAGILAGLDALLGAGLTPHQIVGITTELEGHPDNASAGVLGGFCVSRCDPQTGSYLGTLRFSIPSDIVFVVVSPSQETLTKESRGALPATLPYFDAVKSINSATYVVAAIASGNFDQLQHAVSDFMHEPYRLPSIPGAREAIAAGVAAGALTGWLSGSGSSVLCVARSAVAAEISAAMLSAFAALNITAEARTLLADSEGLRVEVNE